MTFITPDRSRCLLNLAIPFSVAGRMIHSAFPPSENTIHQVREFRSRDHLGNFPILAVLLAGPFEFHCNGVLSIQRGRVDEGRAVECDR